MRNVFIITCRPGNDALCEEEVGNALYEVDPGLLLKVTRHPGVLLLYTNIELEKAFKRLKSFEYGFVERIVPLQSIVEPKEESVIKAINELLKNLEEKSLCIKVKLRGIRGLSKNLWISIARHLKQLGFSINSNSTKCIYIEGVGEVIGVSVLKNKEDRVRKGEFIDNP
ncbi:MAG: hypothetical protein N3E36_00825 [Sulfolobales archaeon]|nr:hypothetical protein [Sulfolobales archaeon]MCX8198562.1 hypothetical protein [Sulfolobales archaeon]MDW8169635.1 hypothetical protein [Desulfurococcaceae archaeon]